MWVCSGCYAYDHAACFSMQLIGGYAFCTECAPWAEAQVSRHITQLQRQQWECRLQHQLADWREASPSTAAAMAIMGVAIGGAGVAHVQTGARWHEVYAAVSA